MTNLRLIEEATTISYSISAWYGSIRISSRRSPRAGRHGFEGWDDLAQEVTILLDLGTLATADSLHSRTDVPFMEPKRITRYIEIVQETVTQGSTLLNVYKERSRLVFVKTKLVALYGYCNLLRSGWIHGDISVNNIILGSAKDLELCDYDEDNDRAVPIDYGIDCLSDRGDDCLVDGRDEKLCGMLIDFDLAVKREGIDEDNNDGKTLLTGTLDFMATILLNASRWNQADQEHDPVEHSPIFDLESFFWVLIYVPLHFHTRGGLAGTGDAFTAIRDASAFESLFGSFPNSLPHRDHLLARQWRWEGDGKACSKKVVALYGSKSCWLQL
ncbi:hypothetical protein IAR50_002542 [Cryptococcus sp. DSM 104548]